MAAAAAAAGRGRRGFRRVSTRYFLPVCFLTNENTQRGIRDKTKRSTERKEMTEDEETGLRRSRHTARADTTELNATSNQIFKLCLLNQPSLRGFSAPLFFSLPFFFFSPPPPAFFFAPCHSPYVLLFRFTTAHFVRSLDPVFQQEVNGQVCSCPTAAELTIRLGS